MFITFKSHTHTHTHTHIHRMSPMRLKPASVRRRGHYTTEDSIKNWPKWKFLLAQFEISESPCPSPSLPTHNTHTQFEISESPLLSPPHSPYLAHTQKKFLISGAITF